VFELETVSVRAVVVAEKSHAAKAFA